jgi:hypothetical protein
MLVGRFPDDIVPEIPDARTAFVLSDNHAFVTESPLISAPLLNRIYPIFLKLSFVRSKYRLKNASVLSGRRFKLFFLIYPVGSVVSLVLPDATVSRTPHTGNFHVEVKD